MTAVRAAGGIDNNGGLVSQSGPISYANPVGNPYDDLTAPATSSCDAQNYKLKNTETLSPGRYCGGLTISAQAVATLLPGTHVIDGGDLTFGAGAVVSGQEVAFVLDGLTSNGSTGRLVMNGTANLTLTSPTTGSLAGILLFQNVPAGASTNGSSMHKVNGSAGSSIEGVIYTPDRPVQFSGNATAAGGCVQVVASTVEFIGNFSITSPCDDPRFQEIGAVRARLAE